MNSGFGFDSTAAALIAGRDLHGKTALVTGGHSGIGLETTRALASAGAAVYVGSRDVARARQNLQGIPGVEVLRLDLADPVSIDQCMTQFLETGHGLDILINNAGVSGPCTSFASAWIRHRIADGPPCREQPNRPLRPEHLGGHVPRQVAAMTPRGE